MTVDRYQVGNYFTMRYPACVLVMLLTLVCQSVQAVTLGQEVVLSALGDPIEVEIEILQWDDVDLDRVQIGLASETDYQTFGLIWLPVLEELNFNLVGPTSAGDLRLLISTRAPVVEPYIELLIVMRWPGGSLLREYVLLFDLPATVSARQTSSTTTTVTTTLRTTPAQGVSDPPVDEPAPPSLAEVPVAPEPPPSENSSGRREYLVRAGDVLWSIGQQFLPAGAGDSEAIYRMLLSLHALNQEAFINGNIALLMADSLLQIPSLNDLNRIDNATARGTFDQLWLEGTQQLQVETRAEPLPEFAELDVAEVAELESGQEPTIEVRQPGMETGRANPVGNSPLLPANTPVVAFLQEQDGAGLLISTTQTTTAGSQADGQANGNSHLARINARARSLQTLLQTRAARAQELEQQMAAMQSRMQEAQERTAAINAQLETMLAAKQASARRTLLLGSLALVLLVALMLGLVALVKLLGQQRSQPRQIAFDNLVLADLVATKSFTGMQGIADELQQQPSSSDAETTQQEVQEIVSADESALQDDPDTEENLSRELLDFINIKDEFIGEPQKQG